MQHRFMPTALLIWSGPLIWAADFLFAYVFAALACARQFADVTVAGVPIVPFATTLAAIVALCATAASMYLAARYRSNEGSSDDQPDRLIRFLALALGALALIAIVWSSLPPLLLRQQC